MREGVLVFLLIISIFTSSGRITPDFSSIGHGLVIQPNQDTPLALNSTIQGTIGGSESQFYTFNLTQYANITLTLVTSYNLSMDIPYQMSNSVSSRYYSNNANLTVNGYLVAKSYEVWIGGGGEGNDGSNAMQYSLTITSTLVKDYHNHNQSTPYHLNENQIVSQVSNYTYAPLENWFNLTINSPGTYRFNLAYDNSWIPIQLFLFRGDASHPNDQYNGNSYYFPFEGFNQTILQYLDPGNYSLETRTNSRNADITIPFKIWYTSNINVPSPANVSLDGYIFGTINSTINDHITFTASRDAVFYFVSIWGYSPILVGYGGENYTLSYVDNSNSNYNLVHTNPGEYTLNITTNFQNYTDFFIQVVSIHPDILENSGNSKDNPYYLTEDVQSPDFTLDQPSDTDWFAFTSPYDTTIYLYFYKSQPNFLIFDGDIKITPTSNGNGYLFEGKSQTTYIIQTFTKELGIPDYIILWRMPSYLNSTPGSEATSKLKIGYSMSDTIILMAIPLLGLTKLRKFRNKI